MQTLQNDLAEIWPPLFFLERIANHRQEAVLNFSIDLARKASWENALTLSKAEEKAKDNYVELMDKNVVPC